MAIGLNPTLDRFVNWANQDGIGKTDLVHAAKAQGTTGGAKVVLAGNTGDGIGFFASRRRSADTRDLNNATRELFKKAVMDLFHAKTIDEVPKSVRDKMKLGDYDGKGHPLSAHRIRSVAKAAKLALAAQGFAVSGSGEVATIIKRTLNAKMATLHGTKDEKAIALKNEIDQKAKNRYNMFFALDMKDMQNGTGSQFDKDHVRLPVAPTFKIGDETLTFNNDTPIGEKQDIIAKFVRKDRNAKFADLKGADLNKAYAVMSIIAQRFGICMQEGVLKSLMTGQMNVPPIQIGQPGRDPANSPLTLSFGDDGSLRVHYVSLHDKPQIRHEGANFTRLFTEFDKGSSVTLTADFAIDAEELEKIASADYTQFDDAASEAAMNGRMDADEAGAAAMGQFRFGDGVKVSVSCTTVLKGGKLMIDQEF